MSTVNISENANFFSSIIQKINTSKYFYAVLMILLNMGAKYIEIDIAKSQKAFLSSKLIRRLLIFTIAFIATRDVIVSLIITATFVIIVLNLFNDESEYCILPKSLRALDLNNDGEISPDEIEKAYKLLKKAGKIK